LRGGVRLTQHVVPQAMDAVILSLREMDDQIMTMAGAIQAYRRSQHALDVTLPPPSAPCGASV
jgi:hypothetical protein